MQTSFVVLLTKSNFIFGLVKIIFDNSTKKSSVV